MSVKLYGIMLILQLLQAIILKLKYSTIIGNIDFFQSGISYWNWSGAQVFYELTVFQFYKIIASLTTAFKICI